uniref:Uncharacterized protein n=1 Tax=Romanomermis culicivorax TaxID=13658 RepID=A0A915K4F8_ROMCU
MQKAKHRTYNHDSAAKNEHEHEIGRLIPEGSFFQHPTITVLKKYLSNQIRGKTDHDYAGPTSYLWAADFFNKNKTNIHNDQKHKRSGLLCATSMQIGVDTKCIDFGYFTQS